MRGLKQHAIADARVIYVASVHSMALKTHEWHETCFYTSKPDKQKMMEGAIRARRTDTLQDIFDEALKLGAHDVAAFAAKKLRAIREAA